MIAWNMKGCISFTSTELYSVLLLTVRFTLTDCDYKQRHAAVFSEESSDSAQCTTKHLLDKVIDQLAEDLAPKETETFLKPERRHLEQS